MNDHERFRILFIDDLRQLGDLLIMHDRHQHRPLLGGIDSRPPDERSPALEFGDDPFADFLVVFADDIGGFRILRSHIHHHIVHHLAGEVEGDDRKEGALDPEGDRSYPDDDRVGEEEGVPERDRGEVADDLGEDVRSAGIRPAFHHDADPRPQDDSAEDRRKERVHPVRVGEDSLIGSKLAEDAHPYA